MKRALITGITGQDGSYLAELLLAKGYQVHGIIRRASTFNTHRIDHIYEEPHAEGQRLYLHYGDLLESESLARIIRTTQPDEIYNLGAQSHVRVSFDLPVYTADVDYLGTLRLLEAIRNFADKPVRFYQASSSEMYGGVSDKPLSEDSPFHPRSPYGVAKVASYWQTINYREAYGLFAANGVLFNHESDKGPSWRASTMAGGSPGADDPAVVEPSIVISEVLAHTDPPLLDTIEVHNAGDIAVEISGWFLTEDPGAPRKFAIPDNTILIPGEYRCFDANQFNALPGSPTNFALSSIGDEVYLFAAEANGTLSGYGHGVEFGASFNGVSFGRCVNEVGEEFFPLQLSLSFCRSNAGPRIGPILINEIHYHPAAGEVEFIELINFSSEAVPLYDVARPTNAWKLAGASFTLPLNVVLEPQGLLLLTATNPAAFRARYDVPASVAMFGPFGGTLQDSGERLEVQAPDTPNTNGSVPYVTVEEVRYNDRTPWPAEADGSGLSLQRRNAGFANSPANWPAAAPTPGRPCFKAYCVAPTHAPQLVGLEQVGEVLA